MKKIFKNLLIIFVIVIGINDVNAVQCSAITNMETCRSTTGCNVYTESRTKSQYCGKSDNLVTCSCDSDEDWMLSDTTYGVWWSGTECDGSNKTIIDQGGIRKRVYVCIQNQSNPNNNNENNGSSTDDSKQQNNSNTNKGDNIQSDYICYYTLSNTNYSIYINQDGTIDTDGDFRLCNWENGQCPLSPEQFSNFYGYEYIKNNNKCPNYLVINTRNNISYFASTEQIANQIVDNLGAADIYTLDDNSSNNMQVSNDRLEQLKTCYRYKDAESCISSTSNCVWKDGTCSSGYTVNGDSDNANNITNNYKGYNTVSCGLTDDIPAALPKFIHNIVNIIKIAVPVILVILGMLDLAKAVTSNDEKGMKEAQNKFVKRLIGGICIFLVTGITQFIFNVIGTNTMNEMASCINCFINNECITKNDMYCYQCNSESNRYLWASTNPGSTTACPAGYHVINLNEQECKSKYLNQSCYQCNSNSNIYKWGIGSSSDENCGSGYHERTDITSEKYCHS